ncbi:MAG: DUF3419 family protein [bacterium]
MFRQVPIRASYFWTVYLCGSYTRDCCPEYPKTKNFERLKQGLAQCITPPYHHRHGLLAAGTPPHFPLRTARPHGLDELLLPARTR